MMMLPVTLGMCHAFFWEFAGESKKLREPEIPFSGKFRHRE